MQDLLIIFESTRYDVFNEAYTPNLDKLGKAVKARTHASWTRPSITSILSGYLPQSELGQIYNPSWVMLSQEVFREQVNSYFINGNAWVGNMQPRAYKEYPFYEKHQGIAMVEQAQKLMLTNSDYFIALFLTESHSPYDLPSENKIVTEDFIEMQKEYNNGTRSHLDFEARIRSGRAIEYLDSILTPLIGLADRIIFTSDHGELLGENHKIGHDPSFPQHRVLFEVPLIIWERDGGID